jgi:hypothetical protein
MRWLRQSGKAKEPFWFVGESLHYERFNMEASRNTSLMLLLPPFHASPSSLQTRKRKDSSMLRATRAAALVAATDEGVENPVPQIDPRARKAGRKKLLSEQETDEVIDMAAANKHLAVIDLVALVNVRLNEGRDVRVALSTRQLYRVLKERPSWAPLTLFFRATLRVDSSAILLRLIGLARKSIDVCVYIFTSVEVFLRIYGFLSQATSYSLSLSLSLSLRILVL